MDKINYKKELASLYKCPRKPVVIDVPPINYIMIDGKGDPNKAPEYALAIQALYSVAYTVKFAVKKRETNPVDFGVMPLEGLWWSDNMEDFVTGNKDNWQWTIMIMQPDIVTEDVVQDAIKVAGSRKPDIPIDKLRFETFKEGKCAQVLHVGHFTEEGPTILKLHEFIESTSSLRGKHHEIYLSDMRKAHPSKWKIIIRQPMR